MNTTRQSDATLNDAVPRLAAASFGIPVDVSDDDDPALSPPADAADAWVGIEAPAEESSSTTTLMAEAAGQEDPAATSFSTSQPHPQAASEAQTTSEPFAPAAELVATIPSDEEPAPEPPEKGGWIVSILCAGIAIVSICLLLPLAEENHQLAWQREKLKSDLAQLTEQVQVNDAFLKKISNDPTLAERLAQRQMKFIRQGSTVLDLPSSGKEEISPFQLVNLPAPVPIPAYQPLGGALSAVVRNSHLRLYLTGIGLLLLAAGLVLGGE